MCAKDESGLPDDCTLCGACCFTRDPRYLPLFHVDLQRLHDEDHAHVDASARTTCMRIIDGHCSALRVDPKNARLVCAIYPRRPDVCRALVRGSGQCLQHHEQKREIARAWCDRLRRTLGIV